MPFDPPIEVPAPYLTAQAIAFTDPAGRADLVSAAQPLPVATIQRPASSTPLVGTVFASTTAGPFTPQLGRPIWVALSGSWTGSVQLLRSSDGGTTKLPLTALGQPYGTFSGNACEAVVEESCAGAAYYLLFTRASGTLTYEVRQ